MTDLRAPARSAGALRLLGAFVVLAGTSFAATTTGRGSDWTLRPDGEGRLVGVDVNELAAQDLGWWTAVALALAGTWSAIWVSLAAVPRRRLGRVLVTVVYLVPPALLAADALQSGGRGPLVAVVGLLVVWPVPLLLLWRRAHGIAARLAAGAAAVGLVAHTVTVVRLSAAGPGRTTPDLWLATCGTVLVLVGALLLVAAARRVSPAGPG